MKEIPYPVYSKDRFYIDHKTPGSVCEVKGVRFDLLTLWSSGNNKLSVFTNQFDTI